MSEYHIQTITQVNSEFLTNWQHLWDQSENANIFNSPQWFLAVQDTFTPSVYQIRVCYQGHRLVGVLPLSSYRRWGVKVAGSVGNQFLYNTGFLVFDQNPQIYKELFTDLITRKNFFFTRIDETSARVLKTLYPQVFLSLMAVCPLLKISPDPLRHIPVSSTQKIHRILKKNESALSFQVFGSEDDLLSKLDQMIKLEQNSTKKLHSRDLFSQDINSLFYKNLIRYCRSWIQICFLTYNGVPAVYSFNFRCKTLYTAFQTAFLPQFKKINPGRVMAHFLLKKIQDDPQVTHFDFGAGINSFKQEFTPDHYFLYDLYSSPQLPIMIWWKLIHLAGRIKKIIFHEKYARDHEFLFKTYKP